LSEKKIFKPSTHRKEFCFAEEQRFFKGIQDFFSFLRMRNLAGIPKFFWQQKAYSQENADNNIFFEFATDATWRNMAQYDAK